MISVRNITKYLENVKILKDISADFEAGKINMIIGGSGSGKSVLMQTILGLLKPDTGTIHLYDADMQEIKRNFSVNKDIGVVFQESALFDSMNVEQNIMLPLQVNLSQSREKLLLKVNSALENVNLVGVNKKYPSELSGGMKKRVAVARAIVLKPRFLFCDEPNSGLDPKSSTIIDGLIKKLTKKYEMTTIVNTHDMNSVLTISENIIFIQNGIIEWAGTRDQIYEAKNESLSKFMFNNFLLKNINKYRTKSD